MTSSVKSVAVVGAGVSGLAAIKQCLDEHLEPVCFEQSRQLGGLWNYSEEVIKGRSSVMKCTITNTAKETFCYSDFPCPGEFPIYQKHSKFLEYLRMYARKFDLENYIRFETEVVEIAPTDDFSSTGRWRITVKTNDSQTTTEIFDAVMLCAGHHVVPRMPEFDGQELFKGVHMHSSEYRSAEAFEGKRVVVVGIGNSAVDIACDLGRVCSQVFLSTTRGAWLASRLSRHGVPFDMDVNRRAVKWVASRLPPSLAHYLIITNTVQAKLDHAQFGLEPEHSILSQRGLINDELPAMLFSGTVKLKCGVKRIAQAAIMFQDGTIENDIDAIIYASGFEASFPNVKNVSFENKSTIGRLFKFVFPPDIKPATIAAIGYVDAGGPILPCSELHSRWAVAVFKGLKKLPSQEDMWKDINLKRAINSACFYASPRHTLEYDWNFHLDDIADEIGCKPNIRKLLFSDPWLALTLFFGPTTPFDYRLTGPGAWPHARRTIMSVQERLAAPLQTRKIVRCSNWREVGMCVKLALTIFIFFIVFLMVIF